MLKIISRISQKVFQNQIRFNFSKDLSKITSKLQKALQTEIKYEEENFNENKASIDLFQKQGFALKDLQNDLNIELSKKIDNNMIYVTFQQKTPVENQENQDEQDVEQDEENNDIFDFQVYSVKNNTGICYDCSFMQNELQINYVTNFEDYEKFKNVNKYEKSYTTYLGPDINTLDEGLQTLLQDLLKGYGIDKEIAQAMQDFAEDKEQRLYLQWLQQMEEFLKK